MTLPQALDAVRERILADGRITNAEIIALFPDVDADTQTYYLRQIRDQLTHEGIALEDTTLLGLHRRPTTDVRPEPEYDLFISYARKDNTQSRIDELISYVSQRFFQKSGKSLNVFYDRKEIVVADDWARRIRDGLRQSKLLISTVSPNYFNSEWCFKEWDEYYQQERDEGLFRQGIAPVCITPLADLQTLTSAIERIDDWRDDLLSGTRQHLDLVAWFVEGQSALVRQDVQDRLEQLDRLCYVRLEQVERARKSKNNLPRSYHKFVGREEALEQMQTTLNRRQPPVLALWGMAGMGKTTLAVEFGRANAAQYPGGRYLIPAASMVSILSSLKTLLTEQFGWTFTEEENKNDQLTYRRINEHFSTPHQQNANYYTLLLFDNVEHPATHFSTEAIQQWVPDGVHVLLTTRVQVQDAPFLKGYEVRGLLEKDSLQLLNSYRPFLHADEKTAALAITQRLDNYPLALNIVGVTLEKTPKYTYQKFLANLTAQNVSFLDEIGRRRTDIELFNYSQKVVSDLFLPLLQKLTPEQRLAVDYAALLPPDYIVLNWLEPLLVKAFPHLQNLLPAKDDLFSSPGEELVRELKGFSIWTATDEPRIMRMHRVLQDVVLAQLSEQHNELQAQLDAVIDERALLLANRWYEQASRWEIAPLVAYTELGLSQRRLSAANLANYTHQPVWQLGRYRDAKRLLTQAKQLADQQRSAPNWFATTLSNLAMIEKDLGNLDDARQWMLRAIEIDQHNFDDNHPSLAISYSNLAMIEQDLGNLDDARQWMLRAIEIDQHNFDDNHPTLATRYSNLGLIERGLSNLDDARQWMLRAIEIDRHNFDDNHPTLATHYSNLGLIEQDLGNLDDARQWILRAIEIDQHNFDDNHPKLAISYSILAMIELGLGNLNDAQKWMLRAIEIDRHNFDDNHPTLATRYSNLGLIERNLGNLTKARQWILRAIEIGQHNLEENHPSLATRYSNLGLIEQDLGNLAEARKWILRAIEIDQHNFDDNHPSLANRYSNLGLIEQDLGNLDDARQWILRAIEIDQHNFDDNHPKLAISYSNLAMIELALDNTYEACQLWLQAYSIFNDRLGPEHPSTYMVAEFLLTYCQQYLDLPDNEQ